MLIERRKFLLGMAAVFAAPAIVRIDSIMPVKAILPAYDFDSFEAPEGLAYQWNITGSALPGGWEPVSVMKYKRLFDIKGDKITYGNCTLVQRAKELVVEARQKEIDAAFRLTNFAVNETNEVDYFTGQTYIGRRRV